MKKRVKEIIVLLTVCAAALGLAGCGKNGQEQEKEKREFYYVPSYMDLDFDINYVRSSVADGECLYMMGDEWDEETEVGQTLLYRIPLDGKEQSQVSLSELSPQASVDQMAVNSKGNLILVVSSYEPVYEQEQTAAEEGQTEDGQEQPETEEGQTEDEQEQTAAEEGQTEDEQEQPEDAPVPVDYKSSLELWEVAPSDGSVVNRKDIKPVFQDPESAYVQGIVLDKEDHIYLCCESEVYLLNPDGEKAGEISLGNNCWIQSMFSAGNGSVYIQYYDQGSQIKPVDFQKKELGEALQVEGLSEGPDGKFFRGAGDNIIISKSNSVYSCNLADNTSREVFQWLDADINSDEVEDVGELSDGRYWALIDSWASEERGTSLVFLTKTPAAEVEEKTELVYATMSLSQRMRNAVIAFNKSSDKYHISVEEYGSEDYDAGITRFNNDLTSGNMPDLIDISALSFERYAGKGVFEDLYPLMEKDGMAREDYLENVLEACEVDGKLYTIMPEFYVITALAKASKVGDVTGWTMEEMLDFAEGNDAARLFEYGTRSSVLGYCVFNNIDEYIDWESGKCSFDGEDFRRVLEFAAKFPEDYSDDGSQGTAAKIRGDQVLLMQYSVSSVQEYQMLTGLYGEKIAFVGYPNRERKSNMVQSANGSVAIGSKSDNKEGAWEFVKYLISQEYQDSLVEGSWSWGFPIRKASLEKKFEGDMTPEYNTDEDGKQVERPKTSWGWDDFDMDIYAATPEEVEEVRKVIASAVRLAEGSAYSSEQELVNIITEETEPFFQGQKSVEDTVSIIQNRIQTYVNENS